MPVTQAQNQAQGRSYWSKYRRKIRVEGPEEVEGKIRQQVGATNKPNLSELLKMGAPRWVREMRAGRLSDQAVNRIATHSLQPGQVRQINQLGYGQSNLADHVVANLGPRGAGQFVRKLPTRAVTNSLQSHYEPAVRASQHIEQAAGPGRIAPYVHASPQGGFQEFDRGPRNSNYDAIKLKNENALRDVGLVDLNRNNFGPSGRAIDFTVEQNIGEPRRFGGAMSHAESWWSPRLGEEFRRGVDGRPLGFYNENSLPGDYLNTIRKHWLHPRTRGLAHEYPAALSPSPQSTASYRPPVNSNQSTIPEARNPLHSTPGGSSPPTTTSAPPPPAATTPAPAASAPYTPPDWLAANPQPARPSLLQRFGPTIAGAGTGLGAAALTNQILGPSTTEEPQDTLKQSAAEAMPATASAALLGRLSGLLKRITPPGAQMRLMGTRTLAGGLGSTLEGGSPVEGARLAGAQSLEEAGYTHRRLLRAARERLRKAQEPPVSVGLPPAPLSLGTDEAEVKAAAIAQELATALELETAELVKGGGVGDLGTLLAQSTAECDSENGGMGKYAMSEGAVYALSSPTLVSLIGVEKAQPVARAGPLSNLLQIKMGEEVAPPAPPPPGAPAPGGAPPPPPPGQFKPSVVAQVVNPNSQWGVILQRQIPQPPAPPAASGVPPAAPPTGPVPPSPDPSKPTPQPMGM